MPGSGVFSLLCDLGTIPLVMFIVSKQKMLACVSFSLVELMILGSSKPTSRKNLSSRGLREQFFSAHALVSQHTESHGWPPNSENEMEQNSVSAPIPATIPC